MTNLPLQSLGKLFVILGAVIVVIGILLMFVDKIPMIGRLPGDIIIRKKNFTFYLPLTTIIVLNLVLWFIIWLIRKIKGC
ncbi:DUF2905 family protein [Candidatus Saccharibacteria bacterium]|nr:DUF2905 family protein [Calditrichia bacterium]NIV71239.1 DUF2905 family protein [Calditrichia bacterium]NIV97694.1 DUF2905 family protein [Candidatus Saccharibacteria bacterium]